jgi:ABC-type glutathione transport system ATPase component
MFSLLMIPVALATKGDFVGAREAVSHIDDEAYRSMIVNMLNKLQRKGKGPEKFTQR